MGGLKRVFKMKDPPNDKRVPKKRKVKHSPSWRSWFTSFSQILAMYEATGEFCTSSIIR